jgi:transmembrane sensor
MGERPEITDNLRNEAVRWLLRMHASDCGAAERLACRDWLRADARHQAAYGQVEAQWRQMDSFKAQRFHARDDALSYRPKPKAYIRNVPTFAATAALLLALGLTDFGPDGWYGVTADYVVGKGGRQTVTLTDGSRVELNTDSAVRTHISRWRRSVELVRGEVYFNVTHDADRPFIVHAAGGSITDIGTAFEVYRQPEKVLVAVEEGSVRVEAKETHDLVAGQQIAFAPLGDFLPKPTEDIASLTAWRDGRVVFRDRPLDEVLSEIGRYHDTAIRVLDPMQRSLRVTGVFRTADLNAILDTIAMTLPIKVERSNDHEIVLKPIDKRR